jgi:hypothetical protein
MPELLTRLTIDTATAGFEALHTYPPANKQLDLLSTQLGRSSTPIEVSAPVITSSDSKIIFEFNTGVRVDYNKPFENRGNLYQDFFSPIEVKVSAVNDNIGNIDTLVTAQANPYSFIEFSSRQQLDSTSPFEIISRQSKDYWNYLSILSAQKQDLVNPFESSVNVVPNYNLPISSLSRVVKDSLIPLESSLSRIIDYNILLEEMSLAVTSHSDTTMGVEFLTSLRFDHQVITEFGLSQHNDMASPFEDLSRQTLDYTPFLENTITSHQDLVGIAEFIFSESIDYKTPTEIQALLAPIISDSFTRLEFLSSNSKNDSFISTELLSRQSADWLNPLEFASVSRARDATALLETVKSLQQDYNVSVALLSSQKTDIFALIESQGRQALDWFIRTESGLRIIWDANARLDNTISARIDYKNPQEFAGALGILSIANSALPIEFRSTLIIYGRPLEFLTGESGDSLIPFEYQTPFSAVISNNASIPIEFLVSQRADLASTSLPQRALVQLIRRMIPNDDGTFQRRIIFITTQVPTSGGGFAEFLGGGLSRISPFLEELSQSFGIDPLANVSLPVEFTTSWYNDVINRAEILTSKRGDILGRLESKFTRIADLNARVEAKFPAFVDSKGLVEVSQSLTRITGDNLVRLTNGWLPEAGITQPPSNFPPLFNIISLKMLDYQLSIHVPLLLILVNQFMH